MDLIIELKKLQGKKLERPRSPSPLLSNGKVKFRAIGGLAQGSAGGLVGTRTWVSWLTAQSYFHLTYNFMKVTYAHKPQITCNGTLGSAQHRILHLVIDKYLLDLFLRKYQGGKGEKKHLTPEWHLRVLIWILILIQRIYRHWVIK